MKKGFIAVSSVLLLAAIAAIAAFLFWQRPDNPARPFDPSRLPPNGLHVSTTVVDEENRIVRVSIVGNLAQEAAGYDIALNYPATLLQPVMTGDDVPATVGDLFEGASNARNEVVPIDESQNQIRMVQVFFGSQRSPSGAGTFATIDFQLAQDVRDNVRVEVVNPRVSRINESGRAEYIALSIGDPFIEIRVNPNGKILPTIGQPPARWNVSPPMLAAIAMVITALLGIMGLGLFWQLQRISTRSTVRT